MMCNLYNIELARIQCIQSHARTADKLSFEFDFALYEAMLVFS